MTGDRIGWFFGGAAIATLCGMTAYCLCLLIQMGMNPALEGEPYWNEIAERLSNNLLVGCMMFTSGAGTLLGLFLMAKAMLRTSPKAHP